MFHVEHVNENVLRDLKKKYIHIIEKNVIAGLDLKFQLEGLGYMVKQDTFSLELDKETRLPDLIISNAAIQNQSDFVGLKSLCVETQLPVICVGSDMDEKVVRECVGVNILGKFTKPFDSIEIINLIEGYFNKAN